MTFRQIEYFMSVAEHRNFSSAARALYVSQPAISQQLSMMEQELGYTLFVRNKRFVALTPSGQIFYEACVRMKAIYSDANKQIKHMLHKNTKQLTIGILEGFSFPSLTTALKHFCYSHPENDIHVESHSFSGLTDGLINGHLDLIITILLDSSLEHIEKKVLMQTPCILVISKNHPLSECEELSIQDFDDDIFYQIANEALPTANSFMNSLYTHFNITPQKVINVPNPSSMLLMLESGVGVGVLDRYCYPELRKYSALRSINIDLKHDVTAAWNSQNTNPLIRQFLNYIDGALALHDQTNRSEQA